MMQTAGTIVMAAGLLVMACGLAGLFRFKSLNSRMLVGSLIDTAGLLLLLAGVAIRQGFSAFSLKVFLIMASVFLTAPLMSHKIGRSAYLSGHREEEDADDT